MIFHQKSMVMMNQYSDFKTFLIHQSMKHPIEE